MTKQIFDGDGIGWLKLSRFKKLMEEEGYRNLVLSKLNRTLDNKISPSDHIDDVVITLTKQFCSESFSHLQGRYTLIFYLRLTD